MTFSEADQLFSFAESSDLIDFHSDYESVHMESEHINNIKPNEKCIQTDEICFFNCEMCAQKFINEEALKVIFLCLCFSDQF